MIIRAFCQRVGKQSIHNLIPPWQMGSPFSKQCTYSKHRSVGTPTWIFRGLSSSAPSSESIDTQSSDRPTWTRPQLVTSEDGRQFAVFDMRAHPPVKPKIIRRRLGRMRTYVDHERNIRHSPWRMNLVCQLAAGLPLEEALTQLEFCEKSKAPLVARVLKRAAEQANVQDGLQPSELEVAECFATKGTPLKRIKTIARGRFGRVERKHCHFRVVLREIDFKLRIFLAKSISGKKKWFELQQCAEKEGLKAREEREELKRLEQQAAELRKKNAKQKGS